VLYEASILIATFIKPAGGEVQEDPSRRADGGGESAGGPPPSTPDQAQPTVQQIIDHVDRGLSD